MFLCVRCVHVLHESMHVALTLWLCKDELIVFARAWLMWSKPSQTLTKPFLSSGQMGWECSVRTILLFPFALRKNIAVCDICRFWLYLCIINEFTCIILCAAVAQTSQVVWICCLLRNTMKKNEIITDSLIKLHYRIWWHFGSDLAD